LTAKITQNNLQFNYNAGKKTCKRILVCAKKTGVQPLENLRI